MENVNPLYARINELEKRLNFYLRIPDREAMLDHHFDYLEDKGWKLTLKGGFPIWIRRGKVYETKKEKNWYTNDGLDFEVEEDGSISKTRNENTDEDSEEEDSEDEDTDEDYYNRDQIPDTEESEECARCKKTFRYYLHDCTCDDCFDFTYFVCKDCEYKMEGCGICGKK